MGWRLYRRQQIAPGVRLNLSGSGSSVSIGGRGAWFTVGPRGARTTVGIPGTGLRYTTTSAHRRPQQGPHTLAAAWFALAALIRLVYWLGALIAALVALGVAVAVSRRRG